MKKIAEENDAKELFNLYQKILDLNIEVQKKRYKNLKKQNEEKYKEVIDTLNYLREMLNDINNEILKYDTNCDEHYMTTAPKYIYQKIYQKLSEAYKEFTNIKETCKNKNIVIENIPEYKNVNDTNSTVGNNLKKIEEKYFSKKNEYIEEDKKRRSEIFKREKRKKLKN